MIRITHNENEKEFTFDNFNNNNKEEWGNENSIGRIEEHAWVQRYEYEASLINNLIDENPHIKRVLEIGSGPGILSNNIQKKHTNLDYHLIDKKNAKKYFVDNKLKGTFFVKDLANNFDTTHLLDTYDLVITNDFLEHIRNPSLIVETIHKLTNDDSLYFISNPNWRMGHQFIYRGLFDFDNFIYFLHVHKFELLGFYGSNLKTPNYPRITSEKMLPDENLYDWNHYMIFKHRKL